MDVVPLRAVTDEAEAAFVRLIPQLAPGAPPPTRAQLQAVVAAAGTTVLVARDPERGIVGALTLVVVRLVTGPRCWIEDVVVDASARRRGVGEALVRAALARAAAAGATKVDLTSRPERAAANRLYVRLGFVRRTTNVYRYTPAPRDV